MLPLMAHNLLDSIDLLAHAARMFADKLVERLEADEEHIAAGVDQSLMLATALAKEAYRTGRTVREISEERQVLPADELAAALNLRGLTEPRE